MPDESDIGEEFPDPRVELSICLDLGHREGEGSGARGLVGHRRRLSHDYVTCKGDRTPRSAVEAIAARWRDGAAAMLRGEEPVEWTVGNSTNRKELGELLARRTNLLEEWALDDELWL